MGLPRARGSGSSESAGIGTWPPICWQRRFRRWSVPTWMSTFWRLWRSCILLARRSISKTAASSCWPKMCVPIRSRDREVHPLWRQCPILGSAGHRGYAHRHGGHEQLSLPDLQYHFHGIHPNWVVNHAYNAASYILANDNPIEDGEELETGVADGQMYQGDSVEVPV